MTVMRLPAHVCPDCESIWIIREHRAGFFERVILPLLRRRAYRCLDCHRRFYDRRTGH